MIAKIYTTISKASKNISQGVKIDTSANLKSIMWMSQYYAYCQTFGIITSIKSQKRRVVGIGGLNTGIGTATIQIPFPALGLIVDINVLLMSDAIPTFL